VEMEPELGAIATRVRITKPSDYVVLGLYAVGALITLALLVAFVFGAHIVRYPEAMIPFSLREEAVITAGFGFVPMFLATRGAIRRFSNVANVGDNRRKALLYLPAICCGAAALFLIGVYLWAMGSLVIFRIGLP